MSKILPLSGLRILVTRARHQAPQLSAKLRQSGAVPIEVPVIEIGPPDSWEPLDAALDRLYDFDWVMFASVNAVEALVDRLESCGRTAEELSRLKLAAIGPATADALEQRELTPAFRPSRFIGEGLVDEFPCYPNLKGVKILWPRTNVGRSFVVEKLTEAGAEVEIVPAYKTSEPADAEKTGQTLVRLLKGGEIDVITLASAQSAVNLGRLLARGLAASDTRPNSLLDQVKIATIGPETTSAAIKALGRADIEAARYTIAGLLSAMEEHFRRLPGR